MAKLSNGGRAQRYDAAGFPIYNKYSPEATFHLSNAGDDSLVRDMQGDVFKFPTTSNTPQDVTFTYPDPPAYSEPSDLIFMPIMEIAALLRSGDVDCLTIVNTFIDRLDEFDPYLAIVASTLYDKARETAESHQALLDSGTDVGPLMCIPFGVKDHHQIGDDDYTTVSFIADEIAFGVIDSAHILAVSYDPCSMDTSCMPKTSRPSSRPSWQN